MGKPGFNIQSWVDPRKIAALAVEFKRCKIMNSSKLSEVVAICIDMTLKTLNLKPMEGYEQAIRELSHMGFSTAQLKDDRRRRINKRLQEEAQESFDA